MEVKDAIRVAKDYVQEVFSDESVSNVGLEEVEYEAKDELWKITVGLSRPWNSPRTKAREVLESLQGAYTPLKRVYKVVTLRDDDGSILSLKNREPLD